MPRSLATKPLSTGVGARLSNGIRCRAKRKEFRCGYSTGVQRPQTPMSVGRSLVYDLIRSGQQRSFKVGSRRIIPVAAIEETIAALSGEA